MQNILVNGPPKGQNQEGNDLTYQDHLAEKNRTFGSCQWPNQVCGSVMNSFRNIKRSRVEKEPENKRQETEKTDFSLKDLPGCYLLVSLALLFIFTLYAYVICQPNIEVSSSGRLEQNSVHQIDKKPTADCFSEFRINKCSLENPIGQICLDLHRCITTHGQGLYPSPTVQQNVNNESKNKLATVQELLENILLLFGGAVAFKMTKYIKNASRLGRWLCSLKKKLSTEEIEGSGQDL